MSAEKKRYVFVAGSLLSGGAERVISILSNRTALSGNDVEILLYYDYEIFYEINPSIKISVVEKETGTKRLATNIKWIRKYIKNNADVIISFLAPINMTVILATLGLGKTVIVADRNDPRRVPENPFIRKLRDALYLLADGIVVQTKSNQDYFPALIKKKSIIIYNPVDDTRIENVPEVKVSKGKIVSVGRLIKQKNQELLLKAFSKIKEEFPDYSLTIYGEGNYRQRLIDLSIELGIADSFFLPGNSKSVLKDIKDAELFVLSSNYEGMSNALVEAMCLGLPVISTKVSGSTDLIKNGVNGLLVECGDEDGMVQALRCMLLDFDLRTQCGRNALRIKEELLPERIMDRWVNYIQKVEGGKAYKA